MTRFLLHLVLLLSVVSTILIKLVHCDGNVYTVTEPNGIHLSGETMSIIWKTSLPDDYIRWCYWRFNSHGAWDEFIGYQNENTERMNISSWHQGWEYTNQSHPCQGGIRKSNVNGTYDGRYMMVIGLKNKTEYESPERKIDVFACTKPNRYDELSNPHLDVSGDRELIVYACNGTMIKVECNKVTRKWNHEVIPCETKVTDLSQSNNSVTITVLAILLTLCVVCLILLIIWKYKEKIKCRSLKISARKNEDSGNGIGLEPLQDLRFEATFGEDTDVMTCGKKETIKLSVTLNRNANVTWFRDDVRLSGKGIKQKAEGRQRTLIIKKATASMSGLYRCEAQTGNMDTPLSHSKVILVLSDRPTKPVLIEDSSSVINVKAGTTYEHCMKIYGNPEPEITCSRNDEVLPTEGQITIQTRNENDWIDVMLIIKDVSLEDTCDLLLRATNESGDLDHSLKLNVLCGPSFPMSIQCSPMDDNSILFHVIVKGYPEPTVDWLVNGERCSDESIVEQQRYDYNFKASLQVFDAQNLQSVTAQAKNDHGESYLKMDTEKPIFYHPLPRETAAECGGDVNWAVNVRGTPLPRITYFKDNAEIVEDDHFRVTKKAIDNTIVLAITLLQWEPEYCTTFRIQAESPLGIESTDTKLSVKGNPKVTKGFKSLPLSALLDHTSSQDDKDDWTVTDLEKPIIETGPEDQLKYVGETLKVSIRVKSNSPYILKWYKRGVLKLTQTRHSEDNTYVYKESNLKIRDSGMYEVHVTSNGGTTVKTFKVTVTANNTGFLPSKLVDIFKQDFD